MAVLPTPLVLLKSAITPLAVLALPPTLLTRARRPVAVLVLPVSILIQRLIAKCGIPLAEGEAGESPCAISRIAIGQRTVRPPWLLHLAKAQSRRARVPRR